MKYYCELAHYFGKKYLLFIKLEQIFFTNFFVYSQSFIYIYSKNGLTWGLCGHDS